MVLTVSQLCRENMSCCDQEILSNVRHFLGAELQQTQHSTDHFRGMVDDYFL